MKNFCALLFGLLLLLNLSGCATTKTPVRNAQNCLSTTMRTDWKIMTQEGQSSAILASCDNGDWRLIIKAEWGSTMLDIMNKSSKIKVISRPMGLSSKSLTKLAKALTEQINLHKENPVIELPKEQININFITLSTKELPKKRILPIFEVH